MSNQSLKPISAFQLSVGYSQHMEFYELTWWVSIYLIILILYRSKSASLAQCCQQSQPWLVACQICLCSLYPYGLSSLTIGIYAFYTRLIPTNTIHYVTTSKWAFNFHTLCIITMTPLAVWQQPLHQSPFIKSSFCTIFTMHLIKCLVLSTLLYQS